MTAALKALGVVMMAHALGATHIPSAVAANQLAVALSTPEPTPKPEPANDVLQPPIPIKRPRAPRPFRTVRELPPAVIALRMLPHRARPEPAPEPAAPYAPISDSTLEASRCRAILLEVIQRAAHDWVLYRTHERLAAQEIAADAFTWLFEECPGHPWWEERAENGTTLMSFLSICETLDIDPTKVRDRIRRLTPKEILTSGRPAERRTKAQDEPNITEHGVETVSMARLDDGDEHYGSIYEAHYAVYTSD